MRGTITRYPVIYTIMYAEAKLFRAVHGSWIRRNTIIFRKSIAHATIIHHNKWRDWIIYAIIDASQ